MLSATPRTVRPVLAPASQRRLGVDARRRPRALDTAPRKRGAARRGAHSLAGLERQRCGVDAVAQARSGSARPRRRGRGGPRRSSRAPRCGASGRLRSSSVATASSLRGLPRSSASPCRSRTSRRSGRARRRSRRSGRRRCLVGVQRAGEGPLGALAPQDLVLLGRELRAPLLIGLLQLDRSWLKRSASRADVARTPDVLPSRGKNAGNARHKQCERSQVEAFQASSASQQAHRNSGGTQCLRAP